MLAISPAQTRHADGLASMLEDYFEVAVSIEEFVPEWLTLPSDGRLYLGMPGGGVLGKSATIGERVFHCQHKIKLQFGPMPLDAYQRMTPAGNNLAKVVAFVRNYIGDEFAFDFNLVLEKKAFDFDPEDEKQVDVPAIRLGKSGTLGWTAWLGKRSADRDADDMTINPISTLRRRPVRRRSEDVSHIEAASVPAAAERS